MYVCTSSYMYTLNHCIHVAVLTITNIYTTAALN